MPLLVQSNQRNTDTTFMSGLDLHGHGQATMDSDVPVPTKAHIGDTLKRANIVAATDAFDTNAIGIAHFISDAQGDATLRFPLGRQRGRAVRRRARDGVRGVSWARRSATTRTRFCR